MSVEHTRVEAKHVRPTMLHFQVVSGFQQQSLMSEPRAVHARFLMEKVALAQFFSDHCDFPISIIPPMLHTHTLFSYYPYYIILATASTVK